MEQEKLTAEQAAAKAGVKLKTWHAYVSRGQAPQPDGRMGRTPWWWASTVDEWIENRAGQGARTDLS
ncbi:putative DNA-binding transcriptional regulator AlpA [Nocardiopsis mwathae]|uniref:Putative DNA-binding transcriptional regulator AlpA n=1 Tax=Nocardiopsis mwathae TaxID=1472723 RepID=A0A7W9YHQ1_9ACTN|nr:transcriptional regulator [Nocardiopsis mwathae]MBB6172155.1 putative DNA-binding transcriptional regulator AlpA [Nocardiopsis mwathae]